MTDGLERQVERGQLFTHSALGEVALQMSENQAFIHGLVDLLLEKAVITEPDLAAAIDSVRVELVERGESRGPGLIVRVDDGRPPAEVDCEARWHVCHGVCCKLDFALTVEEVEAGRVKFDLGRPYFIRHEPDGACTHQDRATGACGVYADRPGLCRSYSCAGDTRIWSDFEGMKLNDEWIAANFAAQDAHQRRATLMDTASVTTSVR